MRKKDTPRGIIRSLESYGSFAPLRSFLRQISTFPFSALRLSVRTRLLIVGLSYGIGIAGLWLFLPLLHNAASMVLFLISACWLFRYRGLLLCLPFLLIAFGLIYLYLLPSAFVSDQNVGARGILALGTALSIGLVICWLRTAVERIDETRSRVLAVEQERMQMSLAYEYQRQLNTLKDQFLLNVSHELRTPLTILGGSLELLQEYGERLDAMKRADLLVHARKSHEELVSLVSWVLDATRVASEIPRVQLEVIYVHQLVQEVLTALSPLDVATYTIHLQIAEKVAAWADPQFLRQILRNLLSNIFKYVPTQTEICIEATQETLSSLVYLSVRDAGPGIPAEELPLLFEKFVRLQRDLAGTTRGTGLGLYICKQLVEAMGGRIWVESSGREGEGSRFCVVLQPVSPESDSGTHLN